MDEKTRQLFSYNTEVDIKYATQRIGADNWNIFKDPILPEELTLPTLGIQPVDATVGREIYNRREHLKGSETFFSSGKSQKQIRVELNSEQINQIVRYVVNYPIVITVMSRIVSGLLKSGIACRDADGKPAKPTKAFSDIINRYWTQFVGDLVWAWYTQGVAPVAIGSFLNTDGFTIPYVPKLGTYRLFVNNVRGRIDYSFAWITKNTNIDIVPNADPRGIEYDDKVVMFAMPGNEPNIDGTLNSRFFAIADAIQKYTVHEQSNLTADVLRSNPPQFISAETSLLKTMQEMGTTMAPFADSDIRDISQGAQFVVEDARAAKMVDNLLIDQGGLPSKMPSSFAAAVGGGGAEGPVADVTSEVPVVTDYEIDMLTRGTNAARMKSFVDPYKRINNSSRNIVPLPVGRHVERVDRAQLNDQLVKMGDALKDLICTVLQVPPSLLYHKSDVRGNIRGQNMTFEENLRALARLAENVLNLSYEAIYGEVEKREARTFALNQTISNVLNALRYERHVVRTIGISKTTRTEIENARRSVVEHAVSSILPPDDVSRVLAEFDRDAQIRIDTDSAHSLETQEYILKFDRNLGHIYSDALIRSGIIDKLAENIYKRQKYTLLLPILPSIETSELLIMNSRGGLPYHTMMDLWARKSGISLDDVNARQDKWSPEMTSAIALGTNFPNVDESSDKNPSFHIKGKRLKTSSPHRNKEDDDDDQ